MLLKTGGHGVVALWTNSRFVGGAAARQPHPDSEPGQHHVTFDAAFLRIRHAEPISRSWANLGPAVKLSTVDRGHVHSRRFMWKRMWISWWTDPLRKVGCGTYHSAPTRILG
jgi:hypothetical protein